MNSKEKFINLFRENNFNCFPLKPKASNKGVITKEADITWQARRTPRNLPIAPDQNYGVCGTVEGKNGFLDLDNKEKFRAFAEKCIKNKIMVIETGKGWHIPVKNFSTETSKLNLADAYAPGVKIAEFQGPDHYVVGCGSTIWHDKLNQEVTYENRGTEKIWDVRGKDFNAWADALCDELHLEPVKKLSRSTYANLRQKFKDGKIPQSGQSNDYFHQAALVCMSEGLTEDEAVARIEPIYKKWKESEYFSNRTWTSVRTKIEYTYAHDEPPKEGRPKGGQKNKDEEKEHLINSILAEKTLYSVYELEELWENKQGFLEKVDEEIARIFAIQTNNAMTKSDYQDIKFKLLIHKDVKSLPDTNDNFIVFKNGIWGISEKKMVETEEIASMGFPEYNYLEPTEENKPKKFIEVIYGNMPQHERPRINMALKSCLKSTYDPRITVITGDSKAGKSTVNQIMHKVLGRDYALSVTVSQFVEDRFIQAKISGKRLLVFQDMPPTFKDYEVFKTLTGEAELEVRGFHQDSVTIQNRLKIMASGNYLAKIPEAEKDAMYSRRLSLIHKFRPVVDFEEDPTFADTIVEEEGEKIISWILNLPDEECKYEPKEVVRGEWEKLASPETEFFEMNYVFDPAVESDVSIKSIFEEFKQSHPNTTMTIPQMKKALQTAGYPVSNFNLVRSCRKLTDEELAYLKQQKTGVSPKTQKKFRSDDD